MQQTGYHSVEEIEHGSDDDEEQRHCVVALEGEPSGDAA